MHAGRRARLALLELLQGVDLVLSGLLAHAAHMAVIESGIDAPAMAVCKGIAGRTPVFTGFHVFGNGVGEYDIAVSCVAEEQIEGVSFHPRDLERQRVSGITVVAVIQ